MKHMTDAYSGFQSFEDTGTINKVEIDSGVTNVSRVNFHVQFVRGHAFRLELIPPIQAGLDRIH